jgi:glycerophosphoryl diester phosphodiesterase
MEPMATRLPSLRQPPIGFAHRGARAHARENTIEAFVLARRLGATGLESDVWITRDGVVVLDHDGMVGRRPRRRPIRTVDRADLPEHVPSLAELYEQCGTDFELSLDVKDPDAAAEIVAVARAFGATPRLWLCDGHLERVRDWRSLDADVQLVHSTSKLRMDGNHERHASQLAEAGITACNLRRDEWSGGTTTLYHRFGVLAFGWDAHLERVLEELLQMGVDAVYCDYVDRMVEALAAVAD